MVEGKPIEKYPGKKPLSISQESPEWTKPGITGVLELAVRQPWKSWTDRSAGVEKAARIAIIPPTPAAQPSPAAPKESGTLSTLGAAKPEFRTAGPQGIYSVEVQASLDSASRAEESARLERIRQSQARGT